MSDKEHIFCMASHVYVYETRLDSIYCGGEIFLIKNTEK